MSASLLVSVCELAEHLDDPDWRIIDCRFDLARPEAGETAYREGHIPGAIYAHLERDLSGPITASSGRHPLPYPQRLSTTFARWGIHTTTRVICYDAQANAYAARLWWLLRWLGHQRVAVLDGGLTAWDAQHLPLDTTVPRPEPRPFTGGARAEMWVTTAELAASVEHGRPCIIDVRTRTLRRRERTPRPRRRPHSGRAQSAFSNECGRRRLLFAARGADENVLPRTGRLRAGGSRRDVRVRCDRVSHPFGLGTGRSAWRKVVHGIVE